MIRTCLLAIALMLITSASKATTTDDQRFLWEAANSRLAQASSPADYAAAARAYTQVVDAGLENGDVYYNMGTALLLSEEYAAAIRALKRAQLYQGRSTDIDRNLALAHTRLHGSETAVAPWQQTLFFLHYSSSASGRHLLTAFSALVLFLLLALRVSTRFRLFPLSLCVAIVFAMMCMTSSAYTLVQLKTPHQLGPYVPPTTDTEDSQ